LQSWRICRSGIVEGDQYQDSTPDIRHILPVPVRSLRVLAGHAPIAQLAVVEEEEGRVDRHLPTQVLADKALVLRHIQPAPEETAFLRTERIGCSSPQTAEEKLTEGNLPSWVAPAVASTADIHPARVEECLWTDQKSWWLVGLCPTK
jgi:hypothetical protein